MLTFEEIDRRAGNRCLFLRGLTCLRCRSPQNLTRSSCPISQKSTYRSSNPRRTIASSAYDHPRSQLPPGTSMEVRLDFCPAFRLPLIIISDVSDPSRSSRTCKHYHRSIDATICNIIMISSHRCFQISNVRLISFMSKVVQSIMLLPLPV